MEASQQDPAITSVSKENRPKVSWCGVSALGSFKGFAVQTLEGIFGFRLFVKVVSVLEVP